MTDANYPMTWQEAVARLMRDRALGIAAVQVLKARGKSAAITRGAARYTAAKTEYDAVIAGLTVALAQREATANLPDLHARLERGVAALDALRAEASAGPRASGEKSVIVDLATVLSAGPVLEAVKTIWLRIRDDNALTRKTIETQLLAAAWPAFSAIEADG